MKRSLLVLFLIPFFFLKPNTTAGQESSFKPSRSEAEIAINTGDYERAFQHYNALLLLYSRDPSYKYYTGLCLVQLQRDIPRAVSLLGSAANSSLNIKSVPADVWFYYGCALQSDSRFREAEEAFNRFVKSIGKRKAQEYDVQKHLNECAAGISVKPDYTNAQNIPQDAEVKNSGEKVSAQNINDENAGNINIIDPDETGRREQNKMSEIPDDYDARLAKALKMQFSADSLKRAAEGLKNQIPSASEERKRELTGRKEKMESEARALQDEADKILLTLDPDDIPDAYGKEQPDGQKKNNAIVPDTVSVKPGERKDDVAEKGKDEATQNDVAEQVKKVPVFSTLEIRDKGYYNVSGPIPVDKPGPEGLVYRIQLAAFKNPVPPEHFKGLYPLCGRVRKETGITYYYTGMFRAVEGARQALQKVRASGFPDAFIVAMMNDVIVSMDKAAVFEQQWRSIPLFSEEEQTIGEKKSTVTDTIPVGTLYFRAEVLRSKGAVKPEVTEKIELLAGRKGLDIVKNSNGETLYLIGNFITFESANDYVSLLQRNGYSSARVAAYIDSQEIPVESARELIKKLAND